MTRRIKWFSCTIVANPDQNRHCEDISCESGCVWNEKNKKRWSEGRNWHPAEKLANHEKVNVSLEIRHRAI